MAVFFGKFGFNLLFTLGFASVTVFLYAVLLRIGPESPGILAVALFLGCLGFTAVATLMAALVSQTNQRHSLFSVIALPLLVPLLLIAGQLTHIGFSGASNTTWLNDALALLGYAGTMITASALLFETIWEA